MLRDIGLSRADVFAEASKPVLAALTLVRVEHWAAATPDRSRLCACRRCAIRPFAHVCFIIGLPEHVAHCDAVAVRRGRVLVRSLENTIAHHADDPRERWAAPATCWCPRGSPS